MTGEDFERRLRRIEEWCIKHDAECNGRGDKTMAAIEALKTSIANESQSRSRTNGRVTVLEKDMVKLKLKLAFVAGLGAAGGGVLGSAIFKAFGG